MWAKQHGVAPPDYAVLESTTRPTSGRDSHATARSCCANHGEHGAAEEVCSEAAPSEVAVGETAQPASGDQGAGRAKVGESSFVLSVAAIRCHGGYSEFVSLPWGIVAGDRSKVSVPERQARLFNLPSETIGCLRSRPEPPPPRC